MSGALATLEHLMDARGQDLAAMAERVGPSPTSIFVHALIDTEPGDEFLLGVFLSKESAEREANAWEGPCRIEVLELEP